MQFNLLKFLTVAPKLRHRIILFLNHEIILKFYHQKFKHPLANHGWSQSEFITIFNFTIIFHFSTKQFRITFFSKAHRKLMSADFPQVKPSQLNSSQATLWNNNSNFFFRANLAKLKLFSWCRCELLGRRDACGSISERALVFIMLIIFLGLPSFQRWRETENHEQHTHANLYTQSTETERDIIYTE